MAVILAAGWLTAGTGLAATSKVGQGMGHKLVRGAVNTVTGPVELPVQVRKGYDLGVASISDAQTSAVVGGCIGFGRGLVHTVGRTAWGVIELGGFWAANPRHNRGVGIPLDGDYAWDTGFQAPAFEPELAEGLAPVGNKLLHGVADLSLGILEFPGQIIGGVRRGQSGMGIVRGFWFTLSREWHGLGNLLTFPFPNPVDNPGFAFDRVYPWERAVEGTE
jgi:hypothetical protein